MEKLLGWCQTVTFCIECTECKFAQAFHMGMPKTYIKLASKSRAATDPRGMPSRRVASCLVKRCKGLFGVMGEEVVPLSYYRNR